MPNSILTRDDGSDHTKAERVYRDLRRRIRDLDLAPGQRIDKNELSAQYGVSRAPLSEAIARLAAEGLVEVIPQSGSFVAPIRPQDIRDSLLIRTGIEIEAVRRAAQLASSELIAKLEHNIKQQAAAVEASDLPTFDDFDESFHMLIMEAINSPRAFQLLDATRAILDRPRYQALPIYDRANETFAEHERIFDAIRSQDPELAAAAMRIHLSKVAKSMEADLVKIENETTQKKKK
jgi:DNA-binding GntR family transcriptional regulator